ncbi:hypothetical protein A2662_02850 [Candidatus Giovannonibacteria bacterium RIFCSPHIGHO2_01_FULL_45_33]|uniref:Lipocalin-like domain-containing protein n=1 Tax=Candidatus Giovannonibacteria bacterium RIFCSPLOWO2_01_FULL_45_34 TaxID=1798351 RepID=A0A1F5X1E1_9BACT|nr:MAG: hypothetical protein A2662_02850 [Candidatus Giovannonibacteria bacterium RIFCSPHIGHO2_01_FULL_45_33]OGF70916.1 MAG: hypothetical protein A3C73_00885 [Candidatus Giovannonibacteria bacterium RIFCSPHIGHO2_02_FULL_44_11]OGF81716.1 MAG: hypothetical protein A2930_03895 [Candidatus Giovannonibacteria bacterium RIFCSPLOWO2_01_FULL_45_34]
MRSILIALAIFVSTAVCAAEIAEYPESRITDLTFGSWAGSVYLEHPGRKETLFKCNGRLTSIKLAKNEYAVILCPPPEEKPDKLTVQIYKQNEITSAIVIYNYMSQLDRLHSQFFFAEKISNKILKRFSNTREP